MVFDSSKASFRVKVGVMFRLKAGDGSWPIRVLTSIVGTVGTDMKVCVCVCGFRSAIKSASAKCLKF